jgi:hypothetical protein
VLNAARFAVVSKKTVAVQVARMGGSAGNGDHALSPGHHIRLTLIKSIGKNGFDPLDLWENGAVRRKFIFVFP